MRDSLKFVTRAEATQDYTSGAKEELCPPALLTFTSD
jgi:hypothetical protein